MKNLFYLVGFQFILILNSFSQTNTFESLYGDYNINETASSIIQMSNGNFVIAGSKAGYLVLKKVDDDGNEIWQQDYNISIRINLSQKQFEIIQSDSESFVIAGSLPDSVFILKTDMDGNQLWFKKYPSQNSTTFYQVLKGNDNSYLVLRHSSPWNLSLLKVNENGDTLWDKTYDSGGPSFTLNGGITSLSSGGYILCGNRKIYKLDNSGEVVWTIDVTTRLRKVLETSDNSLLFISGGSLLKTDLNGNSIWEFSYSYSFGNSVAELNNNFYILGSLGSTLIRIDNAGNLIWSKDLFGIGFQIKKTLDNNLVLCGEYRYQYFDTDLWLLKINSDGEYKDVTPFAPKQYTDLLAGSIFKVQWIHKNVSEIKIEYSTDDGTTWNMVADNVPADSAYYDWIVPAAFSEQCKVKLSETSGDANGITQGNFRILPTSPDQFISVNEIFMWIGNDGDGSHDPRTDGNGFYWPKEDNEWTKSAIFQDGLVFGGKVNGEVRVNGNTHRAGLQPGIILPDGTPDTSTKPIYGIWKLIRDWENLPAGPERDNYEYAYNNWPGEIGAPYIDVNSDGEFTQGIDEPDYIGDMILFYVANDMDTSLSTFTYGTNPMGLEFQTSVYGFESDDDLKNVVFKKYRMINKGINTIEDMFFGYWSDNDLGDAGDDYSGCDTILDFSYTYNGDNSDGVYGIAPAVGHKIIQGPIAEGLPTDSAKFKGEWRKGYKNLPPFAFFMYIGGVTLLWRDPRQGVPEGSIDFYNNLNGLVWDGSPVIDPITGDTTKFVVAGDPYYHTGWYEGSGWPGGPAKGDRRQLISTGPFNFAPGDTQEVAVAILIAQGNDNVHGVYKLKQLAEKVQDFYDNDYVTSVENIKSIPLHFTLSQNYPNPFNPTTNIGFRIAEFGFVSLKVFDVLGREVATLVNEEKSKGEYEVEFDASQLSSGIYFYKLQTESNSLTKKMIYLK